MNLKRILSFVLIVAMMVSMLPAGTVEAWAVEDADVSEMDALSALGIDTSEAPEGFDADDTSNPYGKNTMTVNPVSELYVLGLEANTNSLDAKVDANISNADRTIEQSLKGELYGHRNNSSTNAAGILASGVAETLASGTSYTYGNYDYLTGDTAPGGSSYLQEDGYYSNTQVGGMSFEASKIANGNFGGNTDSRSSQMAMLYAGDLSEHGGLYMRFGDMLTGALGDEIEIIPTSGSIGNPSGTVEGVNEDFTADPYLIQNYMQLTTGDYDGDGIDEVAVFVPEMGNSRILIFKQRITTDQGADDYMKPSQWEIDWTYSLKESGYVSNMVSLVSGDFNEDGISDLGASWGYYYGPDKNNGSKAVVMFGSKGDMLQESQEFNLDYGDSEIVRASFAFGDITGSGDEVLVLGGQYDKDIENNVTSRYVAIYSWNGTSFVANTAKNFKLFAKDSDGNYDNEAMAGRVKTPEGEDVFFSMPLCPANLDIIKRGLTESAYLYLDSLLINYGDDGFEIVAALDQEWDGHANTEYFVEYGAVSGDLVGTGYDTLATMKQKASTVEKMTSAEIEWVSYYKNWWHKWIGKKSYRPKVASTDNCSKFTPGETVMMTIDANENGARGYYQKDQTTSICMPNTDFDTSYMVYEPGPGSHYFTYTDPEVLAVLASPPYAGDLLNRDDLSASYAESTTGYSSTKGSGGGETFNSTIEAGAYVSVEQEFQVFGVTVASAEAEQSITAGFTHEAETMQTMEQTISYSATAGEDMVAFYSIPLEVYEYTAFTANGDGTYTEQKMTVNMPHIAAVQMISLDKYEKIARDYDVLPQIAGTVLTHELGDLSSYPSSSNGYLKAIEYEGTPARVGFSSNDGGSSIGQEINMTSEESNSYSVSTKIETKAGAGAGGVKVGVTFGSESGSGWVSTSTSGNSFSGEIQNMPIEAEEFGYGYCWKIFSYMYDDGKVQFPVVNYLVMDVTAPAPLPADFGQNVERTTDTQIALNWSYDKLIAGFEIYRYYEFPDGSGSYELAFVPMTDGTYSNEDGRYHFEYIDQNLSPYTDYKYQIQTVRSSLPKNSIPSEVVTLRTKTDRGYPEFSINGLDEDGSLRIFPDSISSVEAEVINETDYSEGVSYRWQKLEDGVWTDIPGMSEKSITFEDSGAADEALYRCRTNMVYYDESRGYNYYISAYTEPFETKYSKRTPEIVEGSFRSTTYDNNSDGTGVGIALDFVSKDTNHYNAPRGNVTFTIDGTDYGAEYTKSLAQDSVNDEGKSVSTAVINISDLPDGVYEVTAYYGGSRVFKSLSVEETSTFLVGEDYGYQLLLEGAEGQSTEYTYGESIEPSLKKLEKDGGTTLITEVGAGVTYQINGNPVALDENGKFGTGDVGTYTLEASCNGSKVAERSFTVGKRDITVLARHKDGDEAGVGKGFVEEGHQPVLELTEGQMAFDEELSDLNLVVIAKNTAGNTVALTNDTEPGNYTIYGQVSGSTDRTMYNNYEVKYLCGIYTIIGQTYMVQPKMDLYKDMTVGTIALSNSDDGRADEFSAGTVLTFYATPYDGYEVASWRAKVTDTGVPIEITDSMLNESKTLLTYTMNAEETTVTVAFRKARTALTTAVEGEGTVVCDNNTAFVSGGNVNSGAEMVFTATPAEGYTFKEWRIEELGGLSIPQTSLNDDGSCTLEYQMTSLDTTLRAVFEREKYTLTFGGNMEAVYTYATGDAENPFAEKIVASGSEIVGDTEVLVRIKAGYSALEGTGWTVNGAPVAAGDEGYRFNIVGNTGVVVETVQNFYQLDTSAENGSISVRVDGLETEDLTSVAGGSEIVFTAHPNHGYAFAGFAMTGTEAFTEDGVVLAVAELGSDLSLEATFVESTDFAIDIDYGARAGISYILYDAFDVEAARGAVASEDAADSISIDVCAGDRLELTIVPDSGFMIDKWTIDGAVDDTRAKTYTFENISADIEAVVELISQTSYTVNYGVGGGSGSITSATTDDVEFDSGFADVGGNSTLVFVSDPDAGQMVDRWEIDGETVTDEDGKNLITKSMEIENLRAPSTAVNVEVFFRDELFHDVTTVEAVGAVWSMDVYPDEYDGRVRDGAKCVVTITPEDGYRVKSVSGSATTSFSALVKPKDGPWVATIGSASENNQISALVVPLFETRVLESENGTAAANPVLAEEGETVTITARASSGWAFDEWTVSAGGAELEDLKANPTTFAMGSSPVSVTPGFVKRSTGGGGGGAPAAVAPVEEGNPVVEALEAAERNEEGKMVVKVKLEEEAESGGYLQEIPESFFEKDEKTLEIETPDGTIALPDAMFDEKPGEDVSVGITHVDAEELGLSDEDEKLLEGKPVIDINIYVGGEKVKWKSGKEKIRVSIPYVMSAEEQADSHRVIAVFIDDDGKVIPLTSSSYDPKTKSIVFETSHTSHYSVAFSDKTFDDLGSFAWAEDAVEALSARGIIKGMSDTEFAPASSIRRADFVLLMAKFFELEEGPSESFADIPADAYYAKAVASAKQAGIINGTGGGFKPMNEISRQDMMVILGRALSITGRGADIGTNTGKGLGDFEDSADVSAYAKESVSVLLEKGIVSGDGSLLHPSDSTRRAEVASLLYKMLKELQ